MYNNKNQSSFFEKRIHKNKFQAYIKKYQDKENTQQISPNIAYKVGYAQNGNNVYCPAYPY